MQLITEVGRHHNFMGCRVHCCCHAHFYFLQPQACRRWEKILVNMTPCITMALFIQPLRHGEHAGHGTLIAALVFQWTADGLMTGLWSSLCHTGCIHRNHGLQQQWKTTDTLSCYIHSRITTVTQLQPPPKCGVALAWVIAFPISRSGNSKQRDMAALAYL